MGDRIFAIAVPAAWVAADITLQVSYDNGHNFFDAYDQYDNELTIQAAASRYVILDPGLLLGARHIKLRSGPSGSAVNQTGGPLSIPLICVPG